MVVFFLNIFNKKTLPVFKAAECRRACVARLKVRSRIFHVRSTNEKKVASTPSQQKLYL